MKSVSWGPPRVYVPEPFPESEEERSLGLDELDEDELLLQAMFNEGDASMDSFDLSQFNFLDESMDDLDLTDAKADDTENNFSESESNLETADPEEFDRILLKGHRTVASSMGAFWGSVLAPTASEKYSRHSPARTSSHDIDLGVHQSPRLLSEAVVDRKMVTRSVSAPEIDFQQGSRQGANRAARGPTPSNEIPVRRLLKNTSARIDQPREEFTTTVSSGEDPNPSISPDCQFSLRRDASAIL